jgi:hypothetical protein
VLDDLPVCLFQVFQFTRGAGDMLDTAVVFVRVGLVLVCQPFVKCFLE